MYSGTLWVAFGHTIGVIGIHLGMLLSAFTNDLDTLLAALYAIGTFWVHYWVCYWLSLGILYLSTLLAAFG